MDKRTIDELTKESNYELYGGRHIKKIIEDKIDNLVIENIFNNKKCINLNKNIVTEKQ